MARDDGVKIGAGGKVMLSEVPEEEVEVYCDGSRWYLNALLLTDQSTTLGKFSGS